MKTEYRKSCFFLTPNKIFDEGLKPREFIVYSYLLRCGDAKRQSFPSRKDIAKKCSISVPTVDIALKNLEESGLSEFLQILPDTEELLTLLEKQADRIRKLTTENQQWQELAQKLNNENRLLQKQNSELLNLNSN